MKIYNALILFSLVYGGCYAGGLDDFLKHGGAPGTQHNRAKNDTKFYYTNSDIPLLPFLTGFFGTHGTYRFLTVTEQTLVLIGEGKHGLWRIQENGLIREYRKKEKVGLPIGSDANADFLSQNQLDIIKHNYAHYIPEESWSGYKYPDEIISDGNYDGMKDYLNFVDLSIHHPKYGGKYNNHVPIDLPYYYCTMSGNDFPHAQHVWKFAMAQPMANKIGPLARRAGMDIKETHFNMIRMHLFEDAGLWVNIGTGNTQTDKAIRNLEELKKKIMTLNYQRVDLTKYNYEIYLIERPFFNKPYIFIAMIIDNKIGSSDFSYVRKDGTYWQALKKLGKTAGISNNTENHYPKYYIANHPSQGVSTSKVIYGLPVYGIHHPNRSGFELTGGACPQRGGDWGRYPWSNSGAGFPSNYEEITPICDAVLLDVKVWGNLWQESWNTQEYLLGNAGYPGKHVVSYVGDSNVYGKYTDAYLINRVNPHMMDLTLDGKVVKPSDRKSNPIKIKLNFTYLGIVPNFNEVSIKQKVDLPEIQINNLPIPTKCPNEDSDDIPTWGIIALALLGAILFINIIAIHVACCYCSRSKDKKPSSNNENIVFENRRNAGVESA